MVKPFSSQSTAPDPAGAAYSTIFHNLISTASTL